MEVYIYSIRWYCDFYTTDKPDGKMITSSGVIAANSMSDAVRKLTTEAYENVEWVKVYCVEMGDNGYADINSINTVVMKEGLVSEE
jgi:hypothetical protein